MYPYLSTYHLSTDGSTGQPAQILGMNLTGDFSPPMSSVHFLNTKNKLRGGKKKWKERNPIFIEDNKCQDKVKERLRR